MGQFTTRFSYKSRLQCDFALGDIWQRSLDDLSIKMKNGGLVIFPFIKCKYIIWWSFPVERSCSDNILGFDSGYPSMG